MLKDWEIIAKKDAENPEEGSEDFTKGELMAYHKVFSTMKNQALKFNLKQEDINLDDSEPERDLL